MRLSDAPLSVRVTLLFIIIPPLFSPPHACFIWKMWKKKKKIKCSLRRSLLLNGNLRMSQTVTLFKQRILGQSNFCVFHSMTGSHPLLILLFRPTLTCLPSVPNGRIGVRSPILIPTKQLESPLLYNGIRLLSTGHRGAMPARAECGYFIQF